MAFQFDERGFLVTRNITDKPMPMPKPQTIIVKQEAPKKPIMSKSENVVPYRQYQLKKIEKKQLQSDIDLLEENEKQTKLLKKLTKGGDSKRSGIGGVFKKLLPKGGIGGIFKKGLKKLGLAGLIYGAFEGIADFKDYLGLSEDSKTTLKQKIIGTLGGIANGFSDFVEFISMGTVKLFDKAEAFQVLENITNSVTSSVSGLMANFPKTQKAISDFTDGINSLLNTSHDGLTKLFNWGKELTRTQTKDEKNFVKAKNKRVATETELKDGKNFMETDNEWKWRKSRLEFKLYELKEEEYKKAQKALANQDFSTKSRYRDDAILAVRKKQVESQTEDVAKYGEWTKKKNKAKKELEDTIAYKKKLQGMEHTKGVSLNIDAHTIAINNLTNKFNEIMKQKPTVRTFEKIDPMSINKNKENQLTGKKGGTISWRNNNAGNLKYVYDKAIGQGKHQTKRSYANALKSAQTKNKGVMALDRYGYAIFDTKEHGDLAKASLLTKKHGNRTIEQMLPKYAIDDYTGKANHKAYANSIYKTAKARGVSLKGKKIKDMSEQELLALMQGMEKFEGYRVGTALTPTRAAIASRSISHTTQKVTTATPTHTVPTPPTPKVTKKEGKKGNVTMPKPPPPTPFNSPQRLVINMNQESLKESI